MGEKTKKATFNLHPDILVALDKAMADGAAPSKNVLVERALVKELKDRRQARQTRWEEGAKDPSAERYQRVEVAFHPRTRNCREDRLMTVFQWAVMEAI